MVVATTMALRIMTACSRSTPAGTLAVDRPAARGQEGPSCTIAGHRAYYERWAKTWEFQALLKPGGRG